MKPENQPRKSTNSYPTEVTETTETTGTTDSNESNESNEGLNDLSKLRFADLDTISQDLTVIQRSSMMNEETGRQQNKKPSKSLRNLRSSKASKASKAAKASNASNKLSLISRNVPGKNKGVPAVQQNNGMAMGTTSRELNIAQHGGHDHQIGLRSAEESIIQESRTTINVSRNVEEKSEGTEESETSLLDKFSVMLQTDEFDEYYLSMIEASNSKKKHKKAKKKPAKPRPLCTRILLCGWWVLKKPFELAYHCLNKACGQCYESDRGILSSILVVFVVAVLGIILGVLWLISFLPRLLLGLIISRSIKTLASHGYMLRLLKYIHVDLQTGMLKLMEKEKFWHSRFFDIRVDFIQDIKTTNGSESQQCSVFFIPQLSDNICYLIVNVSMKVGCLIDCGESTAALFAVRKISKLLYGSETALKVKAILSTHKHWDHTGGNLSFAKQIKKLGSNPVRDFKIYGHFLDVIDGCTHCVKDRDIITIFSGTGVSAGETVNEAEEALKIEVISTPCHTKGSVVFKISDVHGIDYLFTGDTLFQGACGAPFEGSQEYMINNFATLLARSSQQT